MGSFHEFIKLIFTGPTNATCGVIHYDEWKKIIVTAGSAKNPGSNHISDATHVNKGTKH